jgi:hypothetical protein
MHLRIQRQQVKVLMVKAGQKVHAIGLCIPAVLKPGFLPHPAQFDPPA